MLCMSLVPLIRGMVETDPNLAGDQKAITIFLITLLVSVIAARPL